MNAEFDVMVKKVNFSSPENMQKPFDSACYSDRGAYIDMDLIMPDGVLHLCGKNDWGCLIVDALVPLLQYAHGVEERIRLEYDSQPEKPDVICLGKNEFRAFDILHRLRGIGEPLAMYRGIPVVRMTKNNGIRMYGKKTESEEPFK